MTGKISIVDPPQEFDEEGKGLGPDAQVWKTYVKEADRVDEELVDGWNKSMGVNLSCIILCHLYHMSIVLTLLVISQTLSSLVNTSQPASTTPVTNEQASASAFQPSPSAICVNILWFLSLSLSVAASLISMLAKEWCLEFMSGRTGPPGAQARRRQRRWYGLESWRMKEVLAMLPSLIHLSLLLFAIGLCVFLWDIHYGVAIPVVVVTTLAAGAYFACTILPFIDDYCSYGTVLSRLYKQFFTEYSQSVRDNETEDETTSRALHWMIVNCETPRSVDVALQSLAGAEEGLPSTMLERCDAWTLIRQRAESIDLAGERAETVNSLYKRALECHFKMRARYDKSHHLNRNYQQLVPLVLGLQACINSIIYKVLGRLRPLDRNREILKQCTWIGPRLLRFEHNVHLVNKSAYRGTGLGDYEYDMHAERSEALAENIIQVLAQHMTGQVELEPAVQCALSTSLILLLSFKMATNPSTAVAYLRKLIRANFSQLSGNPEHKRITLNRNIMADQWNRTTFALLGGAIAVANASCFVKESPCYLDALLENDTSGIRKYCVERVVELG
ncbi:hypothetical protein RSOLAG22IIIB_05949 [Rhizoctonia solani]|uniref:DUF6535 domain-containing protein n=1 Tax=Rhizoctonia solani TaxID=456999 RepID=A0A0K6GAQ6_9AGAM|nr:hypothetical protein RSOLAG22IIIB_05949 [Rhizoctonia solani]